MQKVCPICGKTFEGKSKYSAKCCSRKCSAQLRKQKIATTTKICKLCGKEFVPLNNTQQYCKDKHYSTCPICGKPVEIKYTYQPVVTCSTECMNKLREQTCLAKYGVRVISQYEPVRKQLSDIALDPVTRAKYAATSMKNWGVEMPAKTAEIRNKIAKTVASAECQSKMRKTTKLRFGAPFAMQTEEGLARYRSTIETKYNIPYFCMTDKCKEAQGNIISTINRKFGNSLADINISYKFEYRIDDKSYDIVLPDHKVLIEIDPTYTHNTFGNHWGTRMDKDYHLTKTKIAEENGFRCIHVFDWDDWGKIIEIVNPNKKVIYARNCQVTQIDAPDANQFELQYHIQSSVCGQQVCYGLWHNGELVEVMTFGKPRYNKNYEWELLRLCSKSGYSIVGGAERLWTRFLTEHQPKSIISYCDRAKFIGRIYEKLNMKLNHITNPNKLWSNKHQMITNNLLLQRGYDQLFHTNFGKGTSNEQLMLEHGWLPIYDCGQKVFTWIK